MNLRSVDIINKMYKEILIDSNNNRCGMLVAEVVNYEGGKIMLFGWSKCMETDEFNYEVGLAKARERMYALALDRKNVPAVPWSIEKMYNEFVRWVVQTYAINTNGTPMDVRVQTDFSKKPDNKTYTFEELSNPNFIGRVWKHIYMDDGCLLTVRGFPKPQVLYIFPSGNIEIAMPNHYKYVECLDKKVTATIIKK